MPTLPQGEFVDSVEEGDEIDEPGDFRHPDQNVKGLRPPRPADMIRTAVAEPLSRNDFAAPARNRQ